MFWTTTPPFCDLMQHTADTELGQYAILDTTITQSGSISVFFQPPQDQARKPRKRQCTGMHFETIAKAKAACEQHYLETMAGWMLTPHNRPPDMISEAAAGSLQPSLGSATNSAKTARRRWCARSSPLGSILADAQERGLVRQNVVHALRKRRTRGKARSADRRQKGKLKVGVDIPTPGALRHF